ncbi:MAG TPA: trehalose-6-phosphate synthase [Chloroflexia bacterium]|nr:trehalose-6-phosphate synthase [Chloroflexia bacterium]
MLTEEKPLKVNKLTITSQPAQVFSNKHKVEVGEVSLHALCKKVLNGKRLLIASNRGPVTYERTEEGELLARRGSGGVVTALNALTNYTPITWIAAALSPEDRNLACGRFPVQTVNHNLNLRFVSIEQQCFENYLNVISNPLLWFIQHGRQAELRESLTHSTITQAWKNGYWQANQEFARTIVAEASRPGAAPFVIIHDYQLYLVPKMVRAQRPDLNLLHFTHIPWPAPENWRTLPDTIVHSICESLLQCDIASFQTNADVEAFVQTCAVYLPELVLEKKDNGSFTLKNPGRNGRNTQILALPISIDPNQLRREYLSQKVKEWQSKLAAMCGTNTNNEVASKISKLIVRVDRLDPSKNVLAGFEAYEQLLQQRPDLLKKITFLALLVPTRESVPEYTAYRERAFALIERINRRFGTADWQPIHYTYSNDYHRALAALSMADVILINSLADGMNLVAKEACIVNEKDAVLVLSQKTGAWQELGHYALGIADPENRIETAQMLEKALSMPLSERKTRSRKLASIVQSADLTNWLAAQLNGLHGARSARAATRITLPG